MLQVQKVTAGYGNIVVLRDISFSMKVGEVFAVIGANGAGKSTLLWTISGLIRPKAGEVMFEGRNITGWNPARIVALGISHILQGMHVFAELTVEDNLLLGAYGQKINVKELKNIHLPHAYKYFPVLNRKRNQLAGSLSGGEKQMLSLARGLMCKPKLLLLDEPSTGLAPLLVKSLFELMNDLKQEFSLTTLLVEQNAEAALRFADWAIVLAQGQIVLAGEAQSLINNEEVKKVYLGMAYST
ncbi:MAG: ABC transporter ATP-binding protein [Thermodesulfobacteriota bacterium]|jgi:branched-chain amino acid transport system ATP-binding protein